MAAVSISLSSDNYLTNTALPYPQTCLRFFGSAFLQYEMSSPSEKPKAVDKLTITFLVDNNIEWYLSLNVNYMRCAV